MTAGSMAGRLDPSSIRSIAVIRALALGDMLCAIPSFRAIRTRYPEARVSLVGLPWARELVARFRGYIDEHIDFPGFPGIPEAPVDPARTLSFLADMRARRFDLVVQLHGSGHWINAFAALFGARETAGFVPPEVDWPGNADRGTWIPYPDHGSEIHRLLALTSALGAPHDDRLEFPVMVADRTRLAGLLDEPLPHTGYAVIHPGSSTPLRRWPAERYAAIGAMLADAGLRVVLTGTAGETDVTSRVAEAMPGRPIDLAGRTGLGELAALIEGARVVVVNDTGVSHLAAALSTPSVVIFSGSDRQRWAPLDPTLHVRVGPSTGQGAPTAPAGIDEVRAAVATLLWSHAATATR